MIDLTPLEVRKKKSDFRRAMRGYDPAQVDDFLELVADRLDQLVRENMTLSDRANRQEQQVAEFREREQALTEALVTAQEMREEIRRQTTREAELAKQATEQETTQLRSSTRQEVAQLRSTAEQEVAQLRSTAEQEVAQLRSRVQQEVSQLRATAQQEAQELRSSARNEREREEEALRGLRAQQHHFLTSYRAMLERQTAELEVAARAMGVSQAGSPAGSHGWLQWREPTETRATSQGTAESEHEGRGWQAAGPADTQSADEPPVAAPTASAEAPSMEASPMEASPIEAPPIEAPSVEASAPTENASDRSESGTAASRGMFPDDPLTDEELDMMDVFDSFEPTSSSQAQSTEAGPFEFDDQSGSWGAGPFEPEQFEPEPFEPEPFEAEPLEAAPSEPEPAGEGAPEDAMTAADPFESAAFEDEAPGHDMRSSTAGIWADETMDEAAAGADLPPLEAERAAEEELELYDELAAEPEAGLPGPIGLGTADSSPAWSSAPDWSIEGIDLVDDGLHGLDPGVDAMIADDDDDDDDDEDTAQLLRNAAAAGYRLVESDVGEELLLEDAVLENEDDDSADDDGWLPTLLEDEK